MQVVSREELYEQVWAEPMTKVAAKYGITGTALKKTCDRHDIPTPGCKGFMEDFNKRFAKPPASSKDLHREMDNIGRLDEILC